ncbi:hypothetical protein [Kitasatospora sp. NE20-6]|uniref:hypothetical protein n=1 Tax=Kitasatospora sp. NE20-6 TaxID=2859066 RepID=UPI0038B26473
MIGAIATGGILLIIAPLLPSSSTGSAGSVGNAQPEDNSAAGAPSRAARHRPDPSASNPPATASPTPATTGTPSTGPTASAGPTKVPHTAAPSTGRAAAPPAAQPAGFHAIGGYGCPNGGSARYQEIGSVPDDASDWAAVGSGGYAGAGCNGGFRGVPMSGDRHKDDPSTYVLWTFDVGTTVSTCSVSSYVPTGSIKQVGGAPAYFSVQNGPSGADYGSFTVDQVGRQGSWVQVGSFAPAAGRLVIRLHNRGLDWGSSARNGARLAAAQFRVDCPA